jgi:hypothetical protein
MTTAKFRQGNLLTSIFGGNDERLKAQQILGHPYTKQLLATRRNATILDALKASSNFVPQALTQKYLKQQPEGWFNWSENPVSKNAIQQLLQLVANEPNMKQFANMLNQPATEQNMIAFLTIGRNQGFNKPTGAFGELQSQINNERDMGIVTLIQRQGGIFFAGADHVGNVTRLLKGTQ